MMKSTIIRLLCLSICLSTIPIACSLSRKFDQGKVAPKAFHTKVRFTTAKSVILIPCKIDGAEKNFLFDTGATITCVQRDSIRGKVVDVRGASKRVTQNGTETIKSLAIGEIDFVRTFATNADMVGLKEQITNFGGILGRSIINKANWLIDYPNRSLEISDKDLLDSTFTSIQSGDWDETPYTMVRIGGKEYKAIIDLGSVSTLNVPEESALAKELLQNYDFETQERERYTVGGIEQIVEQIGVVDVVRVGEMDFKNVKANINKSSQVRVGMGLLTDHVIYIDNINRKYWAKERK